MTLAETMKARSEEYLQYLEARANGKGCQEPAWMRTKHKVLTYADLVNHDSPQELQEKILKVNFARLSR